LRITRGIASSGRRWVHEHPLSRVTNDTWAGALATLKTDLPAARRSGKRSDSARTPCACANFADSASVALRISRIADHRRSRVVASSGANHFDGRLFLGGFTASDRYRRNLRFSLSGESPVRSILVLHFANRICKIAARIRLATQFYAISPPPYRRVTAGLPKSEDAGLRRNGISKLAAVCGGMCLREKALQPVASNKQLASIPYNQVLVFKAGEILGHPRT
jgi:hypothetical protein